MSANQQPRWLSWIGSGSCCPKCMGLARLIEEQKKAVESHGFTRWMNCTECMEIEDRQVEIDSLKSALAPGQTSTARENDRWFTLFAASLDEARHALAFQHWPIAIWAEKRDEAIALAANFADAALIEARKRGRLT